MMVGLTGWVPGKVVDLRAASQPVSPRVLLHIAVVCLLVGLAMVVAVAASLAHLGIFPFWWALSYLGLSDIVPMVADVQRVYRDTYPTHLAGEEVELPIVQIGPDKAIALLMTIDMGVGFGERVGRALADRLHPLMPEIVIGTATLGIPVAIEVSRALQLDRYVILQKSPKIHLVDALDEMVNSVTSRGQQRLLLDRRHVPLLAGRRAVIVDDVVATGSSLLAAIRLVRRAIRRSICLGLPSHDKDTPVS